ncbi:MAG TPA: hypothetical protein VN903_03595 [Polyangia bacterium]|nr:hypothetical protein [Polyangia bacterium]
MFVAGFAAEGIAALHGEVLAPALGAATLALGFAWFVSNSS